MMKNFKRKWVNLVDLFLKTIGVNVHKKTILWYEIYQFGTIYPILQGMAHISLYSYVNRNIIKEAIIGVGFIAGALVALASIYIFWQNRIKILEILRAIDEDVYRYPYEDSIQINLREILREESFFKVVLIVFAYESFGFSISIASPFITFLITGVFQACIIASWYPQSHQSIFGLLYNLIFQMMASLAVFWVYNVSQILVTNFTIEFLRQFERLKEVLKNVQDISQSMALKEFQIDSSKKVSVLKMEHRFRKKFDHLYHENFSHCVKHHQKLCKLFKDFEPIFSLLYSVELVVSTASFALVFYSVLFVQDPWSFLSVVGCALVLLTDFYSKCIVGEVFAKMNEEIRDVIFYDMNWRDLSVENRKSLFIFHNLTSTSSFNLKGIFIYSASYITFSQIVRVSYSFLNIIRTSLVK